MQVCHVVVVVGCGGGGTGVGHPACFVWRLAEAFNKFVSSIRFKPCKYFREAGKYEACLNSPRFFADKGTSFGAILFILRIEDDNTLVFYQESCQ